jgi:phage gp29-like protein
VGFAVTLYDAYGRKVEPALLNGEQAAPSMTGIRNAYAWLYPTSGLTPERLVSILRQADFGDPFLYLEMAEEMEEKELHYLAVLGTRKLTVSQLEVIVKPASAAAEDVKLAKFVDEVFHNLQLEEHLFNILDAIGKGFSITEIVWEQGSQWVPSRLLWRDPRWFLFDWISGEEPLVRSLGLHEEGLKRAPHLSRTATPWMAGPPDARIGIQPLAERLAPFKFIRHVAKAKSGLPVRGGLARAVAIAYLFKSYLLKGWMGYTDLFGQPLRLGKYGPGASEVDRETLLTAVANLGTDAAAIMPSSMAIEFVEQKNAGAGNDVYERLALYLNDQITLAVLGQTLTTQMPKEGGSRAAASVHQAVRRDILQADAVRLAASLSRDLVKPIVDLNFGPQKKYPSVSLGLPDDQDVKVFADAVSELADRGLRVSQKVVLDKLGLPEAADDEPVLTPKQSIAETAVPAEDDAAAAQSSKKKLVGVATKETIAMAPASYGEARRQASGQILE